MDSVDLRWRICTLLSFVGITFLVYEVNRSRVGSGVTIQQNVVFAPAPVNNFSSAFDDGVADLPDFTETTEEEAIDEDYECDLLDGRWVHDPERSPAYNGMQCPFLSDQVSCQRNRRPDSRYETWSWEGNRCNIPRFNGTDMLERLRGKRIIIVGDSLNRNQWESLACLLYSSIPSSDSHIDVKSSVYKIFRAKSYDCSVEFYWSPFLVRHEPDRINGSRVLMLDRLSAMARRWWGANVMIFNTGHWWVHTGKHQAWDFMQYKGKLIQYMKMETAFKTAMKTWAKWIDRHVNASETMVFFRSISPEHKGNQWCLHVTEPSLDGSYRTPFPRSLRKIVERTIQRMRTPVKYLNITGLSEHRRDGHPTVYTSKQGKLLTEKQRKKPEVFADCSHWCLPGVPDTWNRLVYGYILMDRSGSSLPLLK